MSNVVGAKFLHPPQKNPVSMATTLLSEGAQPDDAVSYAAARSAGRAKPPVRVNSNRLAHPMTPPCQAHSTRPFHRRRRAGAAATSAGTRYAATILTGGCTPVRPRRNPWGGGRPGYALRSRCRHHRWRACLGQDRWVGGKEDGARRAWAERRWRRRRRLQRRRRRRRRRRARQ